MSEFKLSEKRKLQYSTQMSQGEGYFDEKDIKEAIKNLKKDLKDNIKKCIERGQFNISYFNDFLDETFEKNIGDLNE